MDPGVMAMTGDADALFVQLADGPRLRLNDQGDAAFSQAGLSSRYEFLGTDSGRAGAMVIHTERGSVRIKHEAQLTGPGA
jgi:hypothetical protein